MQKQNQQQIQKKKVKIVYKCMLEKESFNRTATRGRKKAFDGQRLDLIYVEISFNLGSGMMRMLISRRRSPRIVRVVMKS